MSLDKAKVYIQPLAGLEPIEAEVIFDGKTYMVVRFGLNFEQTLHKNDPKVVIQPTVAAYWMAMAELEAREAEKLEKDLSWRRQRIVAFEKLAMDALAELHPIQKCEGCDRPAEAKQYQYCYDCWWARDSRNEKRRSK